MLGQTQAADPFSGNYILIMAVAAALIGGSGLLRGGPLSLLGAALGAFLVGALANELALANVSPSWQQVAEGVIILCALLIDGIAQFFIDAL
jgi:ribose/xylose/arabinose/galactoside ABC-type transport system permease subunit